MSTKFKAVPKSEAKPWNRLVILTLVCAFCSGLLPGASLYVEMLADAGVVSSSCQAGESSCLEQSMILSTSFSLGQALMLCTLLPIGLLFDMFGAQPLGIWGAVLVLTGLVLLQVPLLGAQQGNDMYTWYVLPAAVMLTDLGSFANSNCLTGLLWHFPGQQMLVLSLGIASYQSSSLSPIVLNYLMKRFGISLAVSMVPLTLIVAVCVLLCVRLTPTQKEFYKSARKVLGMPLPPPPAKFEICKMINRANDVLRRHKWQHAFFVFSSASGYSFLFMYQGLASDYGATLFGDRAAGEQLAWLFVLLNGLVGGFVAPAMCMFIDHVKTEWIAIIVLSCNFVQLLCSAIPAWPAQFATSCSVVMTVSVFQAFLTKYTLAYSPPNRFGTVNGMLWFYTMMTAMPMYAGWSILLEALPPGLLRYQQVFLAQTGFAFVVFACYTCRLFAIGFPSRPELLPEDEAEISKGFGCKDFDSLLYVMHMDDRTELYRLLCSTDLDAMVKLTKTVDMQRVGEKIAELNDDELATILEQADDASDDDNDDNSALPMYSDDLDDESATVSIRTMPPAGKLDNFLLDGSGQASASRGMHVRGEASQGSFLERLLACFSAAMSPSWKGLGMLFRTAGISACARYLNRRLGLTAPEEPSEDTDLQELDGIASGGSDSLSKRFLQAILKSDKELLVDMVLTLPVDDLWESQLGMEELLTPEKFKAVEKKFDHLITGKEWAQLLHKRKELKTLAARMIKRKMAQKFKLTR